MINILDYELLEFDEYVSETAIVLKEHREYEALKNMKWYFIELPKFRRSKPDMEDKLNQWLAVIDNEDRGLIEMAEEKNETLKEAKREMEYLTGDEEVKRINELREKWEHDRVSELNYTKEQAIKEGEKQAKLDTAKNMLKDNIKVETISKYTGLSKEEVEELKKEI